MKTKVLIQVCLQIEECCSEQHRDIDSMVTNSLYRALSKLIQFLASLLSNDSIECLSLISTEKLSLVLHRVVLHYFTIEKNFFLRLHNLWILLFRMVYNSSICSLVFAEKSAVYDRGLRLLLLGGMSPMSTPSIIMVPNNDTPAKYMRKRTSQERKAFFTRFARR